MSPFTTLLVFLTKQSYIVGLILMMTWSIIFVSWLTFVLLLWALLIWILPIGSTRSRCLYTSPLLVLYAEGLIVITFVYGLVTPLSERVGGIDLKEVGLMHREYPFIPLLVQLAFTLMFWLTMRQFMREQRLRSHNVSEGIVLQPFGVIFSGPDEEVTSAEQQEGDPPRGGGSSQTMTMLGNAVYDTLAKYWILLCGLMFLIISLQGVVDIFKIIYMVFFLILLNIFLLSFTVFRVVLRVFGWLVVLYSMVVLCMIYTYQFSVFRNWWINGTHMSSEKFVVVGLQDYSNDVGMLLVNLLIPMAFIVLVMIQLHYFHNHFLAISKIKTAGYEPRRLDEAEGDGKAEGSTDGQDAPAAADEETDGGSAPKKRSVKRRVMKLCRFLWKHLGPVQVILWGLVDMHVVKGVFLAIVLVITKEVTAVNGILLLIILLPMALPSLHRVCSIVTMLWISAVLLAKMIFQLNFELWFSDKSLSTNCSENPDFPIKGEFDIATWFGFRQVTYFYAYVEGYVVVIILLVSYCIEALHQQQYRYRHGRTKPTFTAVFDDVTRESADAGLSQCIKFLVNYCFYKFGLEICFIVTVIVAAVRLDVFAFLFLLLIVPLLFVKRRTCALLWPFYLIALLVLFPVAYAMALGLPPVFCIAYPYDWLPARLVSWLYLPQYITPPDPHVIVGDFFQLLCVCLQWRVFRHEKTSSVVAGGGNNYEVSVDVENIVDNPVPNYTFNRSYLDLIKNLIYGYAFYLTLAIVFLCATTRISILGLFYLVFAFYFLWYGPRFLTKPTEKVLKQWNLLIGYNLFVIFMKVGLQIMACAYDEQLVAKDKCWVMQLFGVMCLQHDYVQVSVCGLPSDDARLTWDVICFFFVIFQRRIFTSNYFRYIVVDLQDQNKLASKGAELINEILAAKVRNKRMEEKQILERVKRKMKRIKDKQAKLSTKNDYWKPETHAEAVRGTGGYYMFDDETADELSDLEGEGRLGTEEPSSKNPLQLAFHGIVEDPKRALEIDREHQAALSAAEDGEDADAVSYTTAISGDTGERDRAKDEKPSVGEEDDVLAEAGSQEDDIMMEEEETPEGTWGKVTSALKLSWLIAMRSIDAVIQMFDSISEEYRYVARELTKLTTEGKRRRANKRQRQAELRDMSGKSGEEGVEQGGEETEAPAVEKGAMGSTADERGSPMDVSYEAVSVSETNTSEQFQRRMPRPVRLVYAALYAVVAQSQLVCYFLIVLNQLLSASLLSLPLVLAVFLWAMLSVPRPTKRFWIAVITYTEIVVLLKYLFQFQFYPWNSSTVQDLNSGNPLWWPRLLGIEQRANYAVLDLCILLAVFFHRSVLYRHGLWQESRVVPNLDQEPEEDGPAPLGSDAEGEQEGDETDRGKRKKKVKRKKKKAKKEKEEDAARAAVLSSSDDERQLSVTQEGSLKSAEDTLSDLEEPPKWYQPVINFYYNMIDPTYTAVTDVYVFIFGIQFILFLIILFFSSAFGNEQAASDVAQLISSNTIPISFLLLLLAMFVLIIIDRAIYLCKDVKAKFIYLVALVITIHIWLFFVLPYYNNTPFVNNSPAQAWYFFICLYFGLSAYQITSGYPTRILGNFLCRNYNLLSVILFYGWRVIPFLTELRTLMDWIWTDTTLSLTHWLEVEDIYAQVYPTKCFRNREIAYPVPRGTKTPRVIKYGAGGTILLALILIIWFPLILISLANTTSVKNPPSSMTVEISFGGYEPLFKMISLTGELRTITTAEYNNLKTKFANDLSAKIFLDSYRQEDIIVATVSGNSTGTWDISPPSRNNLVSSLESDEYLYITFQYSFTRVTSNTQVTPTIENSYEVYLNDSFALRVNLIEQLQFQESEPGLVENLIPRYISVPALSSPEPVDILQPPAEYGNVTLHLETGTIRNLTGTKEWWEVGSDAGGQGEQDITIVTFNERVSAELLAPLTSYGIIGLYVSLVLVIGQFVRLYFSGISYQIMFNELPNVDRILKLCLDIYLVRESGEMELEEDLTAKLIFLYRSPETLIKVTKWKTD